MKIKKLIILCLMILSVAGIAEAAPLGVKELTCTIETLPSDPCLYGHWRADKESYKRLLEQVGEGMLVVDSIVGDVFLGFDSKGANFIFYDYFEVKASVGDYASIRYLYEGGLQGSYATQANNTLVCSKVESQNLNMSAWITIDGKETKVPLEEAPVGGDSLINYVCDKTSFTYFYQSENERLEWIFWRE